MNNKPGDATVPVAPQEQQPPIKYDPKFIQEVDVYLAECKEKKVEFSVKGFAARIGTDEETIKAWANKKKKDAQGNPTKEFARLDFLRAVKKLVITQADIETAEKKAKFLEYYKELPVQKLAAGFARVSDDTVGRWKKDDLEFADQIEIAKSAWARDNARQVKSKEWLLERLMNNHFGEKKKLEVEGNMIIELAQYGTSNKQD